MKEYKVIDLSYTDDPERHLKEVRAFHEGDGWRLLSVVHAAGRWLYYLERDAAAEPGRQGGAVTTGADVPEGEAVTRPRPRWLPLPTLPTDTPVVRLSSSAPEAEEREGPGPIEYRAQQPCECHLPRERRRFRRDPA